MMEKKSVGYRFAKLHRIHAALCKDDIGKLGLLPSQVPFIAILLNHETPLSQDDLSRMLVIDKGATARAIGQLEKDGWVIRKTNPDNRRQKLVKPTAKTTDVASDLRMAFRAASAVLVKGFTREEYDAAMGFLDRMIDNGLEARGMLDDCRAIDCR